MPADKTQAALRFAPLVFFVTACAIELVAIVVMTDGRFVYSLDDAYIHLSVAEAIARGEYGVNPGELSSPSSSALWPFLLAVFAQTPVRSLAPLLFNIVAGALTVWLFQEIAQRVARPSRTREQLAASAGCIVVMLCGNVVGLVFTGMEHSLQVLSVVAIFCGALHEREARRLPGYLPWALLAAPLVRYEGLLVALPFGLYFFARGYRKQVVISIGSTALGLAAFSWFLLRIGEGLLPGSVIVKAVPVAPDLLTGVRQALAQAYWSVRHAPQATMLGVIALAFAGGAIKLEERSQRGVMAALCIATLGHLAVGKLGGFGRYEAYIWTLDMLGLLWGGFALARKRIQSERALRLAVLVFGVLLLLSAKFVHKTLATPWGSRDIYRQQTQMRRFAAELYRKPTAVNDLGVVSYQNESYVLDLRGLASKEVRLALARDKEEAWMDELTRKHGVGLVMIYLAWFGATPKHWIDLGTLHMPRATSAARKDVEFFATSTEAAAELEPLLREFARTLPSEVEFLARDR